MSVSQVKHRFEDLSQYLGRDAAGLQKVKNLKDAVNVIRTRLSAADEKAESAERHAKEFSERAITAERELAEANQEIQRLTQIAQNLSRNLAISTDSNVDEDEHADSNDCDFYSTIKDNSLKKALKRLRKQTKYCPEAVDIINIKSESERIRTNKVRVYDRNSIADGWSHESLWILGATVAVLASLAGAVAISTQDLFSNQDGNHNLNSDESASAIFLRWFARKNLGGEKSEEKAGFVNVKNVKPPFCATISKFSEGMESGRITSK